MSDHRPCLDALTEAEPVDTYTWDRVVGKILAAIAKLADDA